MIYPRCARQANLRLSTCSVDHDGAVPSMLNGDPVSAAPECW